MSILYNVHTPNKTFAIQQKDGEEYSALISRIASKAGLTRQDSTSLQEGKDGSGLVYEYEGSRWSLEDDDDLEILSKRFPSDSTKSITFHLSPPHAHAHFSNQTTSSDSKSQSAASALKQKTQSPAKAKSAKSKSDKSGQNGDDEKVKIKDYPAGKVKAAGKEGKELGAVVEANGDSKPNVIDREYVKDDGEKGDKKSSGDESKGDNKPNGGEEKDGKDKNQDEEEDEEEASDKPKGLEVGTFTMAKKKTHAHFTPKLNFTPSMRSVKSHKSKWGDDDAEPLWEVKKREFREFHNSSGVRTVMGQIGDVKNVRMLLKPGHKGIYVSRPFAIKNKLVPKEFAMGASGYTGLKSIGKISITVAGKEAKHVAMICEEEHFDVVLGRTWMERMNIKVDTIDQTNLKYMDNGNSIPCDIVVLKDKSGNKIFIT